MYIWIHGLGQTPDAWHTAKEKFSGQANVACPDLASMIRSDGADYGQLYRNFAAYCGQFDEPLHLCGLSLGGILAMQYTIEHPERIGSLVLIGTQYVMPKALLTFQNLLFRLMPEKAFASAGLGKRDMIALCRSMAVLDFRSSLGDIRTPTLILCGTKDRANSAAAREMAEIISGARLCTVENAGHEVNTDAPDALAALLEQFYVTIGA